MRLRKEFRFDYLLFIPSLLLTQDFLPTWYIYFYSFAFFLICFVRIPKIFAFLNFINIYFIFTTVEKRIIPETMVPFLGVALFSKYIYDQYKDESDYSYYLWLGAFSLFSSSLYYLSYVLLFILIILLKEGSPVLNIFALVRSLRQFWKHVLFITLLSLVLFFFFPRVGRFLPSANQIGRGKIGYSKTINNSQTANLQISSNIAFYAEMKKELPPEQLYWRGRTHSHTDGYNWRSGKLSVTRIGNKVRNNLLAVDMKYEQNFGGDLVLLDYPQKISVSNIRHYREIGSLDFRTYTLKNKSRFKAYSYLKGTGSDLSETNRAYYTQLPKFMPRSLNTTVVSLGEGTAQSIIENFRNFILKENFSYSLSPGNIPTMKSFLDKKVGYCTHYASLLGIILRANKIPARLVSGFQGGKYNDVGKFYEVRSSDAHAWVEYYESGRWHRVDPTSFISPLRISYGGERFFNPVNEKSFLQSKFLVKIAQLSSNLNYKVSLFLDNYNRSEQMKLIKKLLSYIQFKNIGFFITFMFVTYFLLRLSSRDRLHPADKLIVKMGQKYKVNKNQILASPTIEAKKSLFANADKYEEICDILDVYAEAKYSSRFLIHELGKKISLL